MPIHVLYVSEHMKKTSLVEVVHVGNGSMRSVSKIVNQIGMVTHDFVLIAIYVIVIFSIIAVRDIV